MRDVDQRSGKTFRGHALPPLGLGLLSLVALVVQYGLCGCASSGSRGAWGADVRPLPGTSELGRAASAAVTNPATWVPVVAALVLQIDDLDGRLTRWGADRTPIYGSNRDASRWSDDLRLVSTVAYGATALAAPSGDQFDDWALHKVKGLSVGVAARAATYGAAYTLKRQTDRLRPDESDRLSFPSGHAAGAAVLATMAISNVDHLPARRRIRLPLQTAIGISALGTAWARVEARKHHASDVLVGLALGHFLGAFMEEAFMGSSGGPPTDLRVTAAPGGGSIRVGFQFD